MLLVQDPRAHTDDPVTAVRRILSTIKEANPQTGGPDQIVSIDSNGAHWVSRLPVPATPVPAVEQELAVATISATVQMLSPTITGGAISAATLYLSVAGETVTVNAANPQGTAAVAVASTTSTSRQRSYRFEVWNTGYENSRYSYVQPASVTCNWGTDSAWIDATTPGFWVSGPAAYAGLYVNGSRVVGPRQSRPVTLADVINVLIAHGLCS
jgi:hypothetical protein